MMGFLLKQCGMIVLALFCASLMTVWFWVGAEKAQWPVDFSQMNATVDNFPPPDQTYLKHINHQLFKKAKIVGNNSLEYPEDLAVSSNGTIYCALFDGRIIRITPQGQTQTLVVIKDSGMTTGIVLSEDQSTLFFLNQNQGLMVLQLETLKMTQLAGEYQGKPLNTLNGVAVDEQNGIVYVTQSSSTVPFKYMGKEFLLRQPSGRVLSYSLLSNEMAVVMDGLCFPNGIAVDQAKQAIIVAELNKYRLLRHYVGGRRKGETQVLLSNLFGYPDNLKWDEQGSLLLGVPAIRQPSLEFLNEWPGIRKLLLYVPDRFLKPLNNVAGGVRVDPESGQILEYIFGDQKTTFFCSTLLEKRGRMYFGSLKSPKIVVVLPEEQQDLDETATTNDEL